VVKIMESITIHDRNFRLSITPEMISATVGKIARKLNKDLKGKDVIFVPVLNGAFMFASDLLKELNIPCRISFIKISSYVGMNSSGVSNYLVGLSDDLRNKTIVILEDIVDSGKTLHNLINEIRKQEPAEIMTVTLLFKPGAYRKQYKIDYSGFSIPEDFVIGYGLDYNGLGRNLRGIYTATDENVT